MSKVDSIKAKITVTELWRKLYPSSAPSGDRNNVYHSPFRTDKAPSFSIYDGGRKFKDHATGDNGSVIGFAMLAYDCTKEDAITRLTQEVSPLPERKLPPASGKKPLDRKLYDKLVKQCLADFTLEEGSCIHHFLTAKGISFDVARALNREGSLGIYQGAPAYIYANGIKVRHNPDSSRSTRWLIGSDGGLPWRYSRLSPKTSTVVLTEGESDAMCAMSAIDATGRGVRVLAAPNASWRPNRDLMTSLLKDRHLLMAFDNDMAGGKLVTWIADIVEAMPRQPGCLWHFPWFSFPTSKDLCDIGPTKLAPTLQRLIET